MNSYRLDVYDNNKTLKAIVTDFSSLAYTRNVNKPDSVVIEIDGEHPLLAQLQKDWTIEIWRKAPPNDWRLEVASLYQDLSWKFTDRPRATLKCVGVLSLLSRRIVAYYAGTVNKNEFASKKAETIAKTLVRYNATADASTSNGRLVAGQITGISCEADAATGDTLDWYCAYDNLLTTLQDLTTVGGGDISLDRISVGNYEFRWHLGQLGQDLRSKVLFSLTRGNMANPTYEITELDTAYRAIVGGKGERADRQIQIVNSDNYSSQIRDSEIFLAATDIDTTNGLNTRGLQKLRELSGKKRFDFEVVQTPASQYGVDYDLGDIVTGQNPYNQQNYVMKIESIGITLNSNGEEKISVNVEEI